MDYYGNKTDEFRHNRNKSRESSSASSMRMDRHGHDQQRGHGNSRYDSANSSYNNRSGSGNSRRSRSRSPMSRDNKPQKSARQFYDSSQTVSRSHNNNNSASHQQQQQYRGSGPQFNRYDEVGNNSNGSFNSSHSGASGGGYNGDRFTERGSFNPGPPSRTIMLRQLPYELDDQAIRSELTNIQGLQFRDLRLVRNRDSGQSRGFAFVEFNAVEDAQRWMNATQGVTTFSNYDNRIQLFYSSPKEDLSASVVNDWDCAKCGIKNFKRRDRCFKCNITREESDRRNGGDGFSHTGSTPCNTLIFRGLDALTTDQSLMGVVNTYTNFSLTIKNCHVARDPFTHVSRGFAFVEMNSIQEATHLFDILGSTVEVEGKQIAVNFSKNTFNTALTQLDIENKMDFQPLIEPVVINYNKPVYEKPRSNQADQANSAAAVAQAAMQSMHKKQELISHLTNHMKHEWSHGIVNGIDSAATINLNGGGNHLDSSVSSGLKMLGNQIKVYPTPDPSKFVYDETSGYYYDYSTGFYYDVTSQYYFNSMTQQYLYWDASKSTYIPVDQSGTAAASEQATEVAFEVAAPPPPPPAENKEVKPKAVVKTAAQIAKEMENWAKSQNKKSTATVSLTVKAKALPLVKQAQAPAFVALESVETVVQTSEQQSKPEVECQSSNEATEQQREEPPNSKNPSQPHTLKSDNDECSSNIDHNSNDADSSSGDKHPGGSGLSVEEHLRALIDTNKLACLLCKRQFDSLDILNKHTVKSDLHKKNLEKYKLEHGIKDEEKSAEETAQDSLLIALKYRDRASERRSKHKSPEPDSAMSSKKFKSNETNKRRDYESKAYTIPPPPSPLESESVASKLMKKMGWSEGSGIGKNLQGRAAPIEATMRQKGAGIGSANLYEIDPNDSYSVAVKKSARARYESLK